MDFRVHRLKLDLKSDLSWLIGVLAFCILFFLALTQLSLWPLVVGVSLATLCLSVLLLAIYFVREARTTMKPAEEKKATHI